MDGIPEALLKLKQLTGDFSEKSAWDFDDFSIFYHQLTQCMLTLEKGEV